MCNDKWLRIRKIAETKLDVVVRENFLLPAGVMRTAAGLNEISVT